MRRHLTEVAGPVSRLAIVATIAVALVVATVGLAPSASARPVRQRHMLTLAGIAKIYPVMRRGYVVGTDPTLIAPAFDRHDGKLRCDRFRSYAGSSHRGAWFTADNNGDPILDVTEHLVRFRSTAGAKAVLRHYRQYVRACHGTTTRTDPDNGARIATRVQSWHPHRIGNETVGVLTRAKELGITSWWRTVVVRHGRTVVALDVYPAHGKPRAGQEVRLMRRALARAV